MKKGQKSVTNGVENFLCPVTDMYVTQGAGGSYSHKGTMAVDIRGLESGVRYAYYAPCTVKCLRTYSSSGQVMWQSTGKVRCANGYIGVVTFVTCHDDTMDAYPGLVVSQGSQLGNMGTKGNATGVHVHFQGAETADTTWTKNSYGIYYFPHGEKDIDELCFFDDTNIMNCPSLRPIYISSLNPTPAPTPVKQKFGNPVSRNASVNQIEIEADNVRARKSPNGEIKGYMNKGIYNTLETRNEAGYEWHRVDNELWFAAGEWSKIYKAQQPTPTPEPTPTPDYKLKGIDISHHKDGINLDSINTDFIIMKATEGVGYEDSKFKDFFAKVQAKGKHNGVFHVGRPDLGNAAKDEADYFLSIISDCVGKSMLILDLEPKSTNVGWAKEWLDYVYSKTGVKPVIYLGKSQENNNDWSSIASEYPLWIASYGINDGNPGTKPTTSYWKGYIMWQYTDKGRLDGYSGDLDLNYFYKDNWNDYVVPQSKPEPTPTPEPTPAPEPTEDKDKKIAELEKENASLKEENKILSDKIAELEKKEDVLYSHKVMKDDLYAIELHKGETIIVKATEE